MLKLYIPRSKEIEMIINNIRDLMTPFQNRSIYHWTMNGSYSLKYVLRALIPECTYEHLDIQDGGMAMNAYETMNQSNDPAEIERICKALLEYCSLDTLAMVKILKKLQHI